MPIYHFSSNPTERTHSVVKVYGCRGCCYCWAARQVWRYQTNAPLLVKTSVETVPPHCMNKKKNTLLVFIFLLVAGMGLEPHDLQVMSLTSYRTALPRVRVPI